MRIQIELVTGLLCIALVKNQNTDSKAKCSTQNLSVNCSARGFQSIPQDLDMKITALDMSYNPIVSLTEDDFKRYKELITLRLFRLIPPYPTAVSFHSNAFSPLVKLLTLDMSESPFNIHAHVDQPIAWPKNLKNLSINNLKHYNDTNAVSYKFLKLDISKLEVLLYLYASHHSLDTLPGLHPKTVLIWVDLFANPLSNLTAEQLAPYCTIRFIRVGHPVGNPGGSGLDSPISGCQCRRVEQWMINHDIGGFDLICGNLRGECDYRNFSEDLLSVRRACLSRQPTSPFWKYLIVFAVISLIFPTLYFAREYYLKKKKAAGAGGASSNAAPVDGPSDAGATADDGGGNAGSSGNSDDANAGD